MPFPSSPPSTTLSRFSKSASTIWIVGLALTIVGFQDYSIAFSQQDPTVLSSDRGIDHKGIEYFEKHIRPIFAEYCYSCHSSQAAQKEGGLSLDLREGWLQGGERGAAVVPGEPTSGTLLKALSHADSELKMPPDEPLPREAVNHIERWIQLGAPSPTGILKVMNSAVSDPEVGKSHWAFQPLHDGIPPNPSDNDSSGSPIDAWIAKSLADQGIQPNAPAPKRDWIRRVYVQLTGLLPTQQQLDNALANDSIDAKEQLVDELLASPQFGERFGRHWLDLARYADSNGLDENFLFREAWRYRNWVIQAVNADLPFDQFLLEQLAGDLLPYESIEQRDNQRIASGFLLVGPKVLLGNPPENQKMEIADEQLDTIGKAILGQTLGCARCHDHKFDPVPTRDYYALAGILTSTRVMQQRFMLNEQRVMERLVGLGENGQNENEAYEAFYRERPKLQKQIADAKSALETLKGSDQSAIETLLKDKASAVAEKAQKPEVTQEERIQAQKDWVAELEHKLKHPPAIPPRAMIPQDVETPVDEAIRLAGHFNKKGDVIPRGFLQVLSNRDDQELAIPSQASGRVELSRWLTDSHRRSGQLAARVTANRIWHQLFGRGIVRTVDNFGRTGELPSHPELLDHLAHELIDGGWSIKTFVRKLVLTQTFALGSEHNVLSYEKDPENAFLWRYPRRRLDPETMRDSMLSVAGTLDLRPMQSSVHYLGDQATAVGANKVRRRTDFPCRSVYLPVIRNDLPEILDVFDFADPHSATGARRKTMVPGQALFMLNSDLVIETASRTASNLLDQGGPARELRDVAIRLYEVLFQTVPNESDLNNMERFLQKTEQSLPESLGSERRLRTIAMACQALMASSRFQIME
jgi:hypothetical protein